MSCPVDLISTAAAISKSAVQVSETQTLFEKNLNSNSEVTFRIVMIFEKMINFGKTRSYTHRIQNFISVDMNF